MHRDDAWGGHRSDVARLLGMARRAGALATGVAAVRDTLRRGRAYLVLTAADASVRQLNKVERLRVHRGVSGQRVGSSVSLGVAVGCAPLATVAVTDRGLAEAILRGFEEHVEAGRNRPG